MWMNSRSALFYVGFGHVIRFNGSVSYLSYGHTAPIDFCPAQ